MATQNFISACYNYIQGDTGPNYRHPGISLELDGCSSEFDVMIKKILALLFEGLNDREGWLCKYSPVVDGIKKRFIFLS